jgi:putative serine protease PepD
MSDWPHRPRWVDDDGTAADSGTRGRSLPPPPPPPGTSRSVPPGAGPRGAIAWPTGPPPPAGATPPDAVLLGGGPPQVGPWSGPPAPRPARRTGRLVLGVLAVVVLLAASIGAVIVAGDRDDAPTAAGPGIDRDAATSPLDPSTTVPPPIQGNTEEPIADVARAVGPSVVLIETSTGAGSGIVYDASGLILTNAHVVEGYTTVEVTLADGTRHRDAQVVGRDQRRDIAVVRVNARSPLTAAVFGRTDDVRVGQTAVAIGSPFGLEQTVTAGIVSAVGRVVSASNPVEMIQTDAPINPGNSGGPLADKQGRVIGMNTSIRTTASGGSVGVGFAIPSDTLRVIANRIVNGESLDVAYLGIVGTTPVDGDPGVLLREVRPGSPAAQAGLRVGDRISGIEGTKVTSMLGLSARIQLHKPGDSIELRVERADGRSATVTVTLGTLPPTN